MKLRPHLALAAALALLTTRAAAEEPHPRVRLDVSPCIGVSASDVRRIVAVELGALLTRDGDLPDATATRVEVRCDQQIVRLVVEDPITGKSLQRSVDLDDSAPSTRARLIALAASELVYASWAELAVNPQPEVPVSGPRPAPEIVAAVRDTVQRKLPVRLNPPKPMRILGVASRRWFLSEEGDLWGGGVRLADDPFALFGWSADAIVEHGRINASLGSVDIDTATLGGSIVLHREWGPLSMRAGMGLRMGAARMSGQPHRSDLAIGRSVWAPWGWPLGVVALSITPIRPLVIEAQGEAGYVVLPLGGRVGGTQEITLAGAFAVLQLGVGMYL